MENGFYWVRVISRHYVEENPGGHGKWTVGERDSEYSITKLWQIIGSEETFTDNALEVGRKIEQPEED